MNETIQMEKTLTNKEAASFLGIAPGTLNNWRHRGDGPNPVKIGRLVRYRLRDLLKYLDQNTQNLAAN